VHVFVSFRVRYITGSFLAQGLLCRYGLRRTLEAMP